MPAWKSDLSGMDFLVDCKLSSSDDDSVDSGSSIPWVDETAFDVLDAYLHENPPGWSPYCECEDSRLSLCSFCLSNSNDSFFSLPMDDMDRFDLFSSVEQIQDQSHLYLYPDVHDRDDLVVLGVDLPALSSAVLSCQDTQRTIPHQPYNQATTNNVKQPIDCNNNPIVVQQQLHQDYSRLLNSNNSRTAANTQLQEWYSSLGVTTGAFVGPKVPQPRQRRGAGGRRAIPEEEKIFPCPYVGCARVYSKNSHLRAHLRRHTGEKPFVCQWPGCKWRFSRSDELARHKRSHSGVKPYQCTICGKRFGRSDHLAKHVRIHRKQGYVVPAKTNSKASSVKVQILNPRA